MPRASLPLVLAMLAGVSLPSPIAAQQDTQPTTHTTIHGAVRDSLERRPVRSAVVRVVQTGVSTLTDDDGRFILMAPPGEIRLEVRAIGYLPAAVTFLTAPTTELPTIYVRPMPILLAPIAVTAPDDPARRIIRAAIARKHQLFAALHDYRYNGYVKFVLRDLRKSQDSASAIMLITETRTAAYWEQPDKYQETILARRQSSNVDAQRNLVSVGQILNFNRERVDIGQFQLVSPIADDALDAYDYTILDTLQHNGRAVFRLAITPNTDAAPRFAGMIDIVDSTFDVEAIDVGVNAMVRFNFMKNLRYRQQMRNMGGDHWMPGEIKLSGQVHIGGPFPSLEFEHTAALDSFRFNEARPPATLAEYRVVVDDHADRPDSTLWAIASAIPLTENERAAWARIDSIHRLPPSVPQVMLRGLGAALVLSASPDFFRFNRVEGAYVGLGRTWWQMPGWVFDTRLGYAIGDDRWQYRLGAYVRLSEAQRLWVGGSVHDATEIRPTIGFRAIRSSLDALLFGIDQQDYYRARGFTLGMNTKVIDFVRFDLLYNDEQQWTLPVVSNYTVFSGSTLSRSNPVIADGHMRSVSGYLSYDSRPFLRQNSTDFRMGSITWDRIVLGAEVANPALIPNDFTFGRYTLTLERRQRTWGIGLTTLSATGALATQAIPPQRAFGVNVNIDALGVSGGRVSSLADSNLTARKAVTFTMRHDFDRLLLANSHLPLIRKLPFTVSVQGGVFWTELAPPPPGTPDSLVPPPRRTTTTVGFRLGNLTPFLSPFNFGGVFTWQFSTYLPRQFRFGIDLAP